MASQKEKQAINERQSGKPRVGFHSGRAHNPVQKVAPVKYDPKAQQQALRDRQTAQDHE